MKMNKIGGLVFALGFGCLLFGADNPFVGTWKMNIAKSSPMQFSPEGKLINKSEITEDMATVAVEGDTITVRSHSTISGKPFPSAFSVPTAGGPVNYTEGPPPAGITDTLKVIDDRTYDFISTENGKVVLTTRCVVSANNKRMTITSSGVDLTTGKAFKTVEVSDRQ
jgi:hypothetical protein